MATYIPPPAGVLDAETEEATAAWAAVLAAPDPWLKLRVSEVDGIAAILAAQFPGVPAGDLGRILASASMALGAICAASEATGTPLTPWDLAVTLGYAGTRLATAGGEMAAMQGEGQPK
jgi:hypothetical protein